MAHLIGGEEAQVAELFGNEFGINLLWILAHKMGGRGLWRAFFSIRSEDFLRHSNDLSGMGEFIECPNASPLGI